MVGFDVFICDACLNSNVCFPVECCLYHILECLTCLLFLRTISSSVVLLLQILARNSEEGEMHGIAGLVAILNWVKILCDIRQEEVAQKYKSRIFLD